MWGWGLVGIAADVGFDDVVIGTTMEDYLDTISRIDSVMYFHNLAFDGSFILDYIMRDGYEYVAEYARPGQFTCLISAMAKFYSITVKWRNGKTTEFRDSLKKIPMSVDRMAKAFKLDHRKLEIDYQAPRPVGHVLTDHEKLYIAADVIIVAQALAQQLAQGMKKLTVGADSLEEYKTLYGKKLFPRTFPILSPGMDADIRKAYRGGWTYCDPRRQGRIIDKTTIGNHASDDAAVLTETLSCHKSGAPVGAVYDVNSLYPSVMKSALLPYGVPEWFEGLPVVSDDFPLFIMSITFVAKIKPGHVPVIQVKGSSMFGSTEYLSEVSEPTTLSITNVDLEMWEKHYDFEILSYNGGWRFHGLVGFFDEYIEKWSHIKATAEGGMREIAKLHLNSLYGKFATNPNITGKFPELVDDVLHLTLGPEETRDPVYTAMGVFITAYARQVTVTAAQDNYATFAYADTDSIHLLTPEAPVGIVVDPKALGAWKREYYFDAAVFWRAKAYSEREPDGTLHTHIAGLPISVAARVGLEDFAQGAEFEGKLLPQRVPGGIVLVSASYTLK